MTHVVRVPCYRGTMVYEIGTDTFVVHADVPFETIAHGLAAVSRFGGQTERPHSVAEHSVRLGWLLRDHGYGPVFEKAAHIHDGPECLGIGDMNSFVKKAIAADRYKKLDTAVVTALWNTLGCRDKYGVEWVDVEPVVHKFDKWLGHHEAMTHGFYVPPDIGFDPGWGKAGHRDPQTALLIGCWDHQKAKDSMIWNWEHADGRG